ncbi:MAG: S26 family signal peptidase [Candidatus Planktophila sp.]|nr:S26 family signal peptidase [Candidatus Planktophila sp.]
MYCHAYGDRLPVVSKFGTVRVEGASMSPTYNDGDWLLVLWMKEAPNRVSLGSIAVIEREGRPGIFLIKRIEKAHAGNYWVEGDNSESSDSRTWGWISANEIVGRVVFRYRKSKG